MSIEYVEEILKALNKLLENEGMSAVSLRTVKFVMDKDICYGPTWTVPSSKLIDSDELDKTLVQIFSGGPSWVHANLITTYDVRSLVALTGGAKVGNPNPDINTSVEVNKLVELLNN